MFLSDWMQRAQKKTNVTSIFVTIYTHQGKNEQHFMLKPEVAMGLKSHGVGNIKLKYRSFKQCMLQTCVM